MNAWAAGAIGAVAGVAGGVLGFFACAAKWPRYGSDVDGGAILGILLGFPIGYVAGLVGGLVGVRAWGGPFLALPAVALGLAPLALLVASLFVFRKKRSG